MISPVGSSKIGLVLGLPELPGVLSLRRNFWRGLFRATSVYSTTSSYRGNPLCYGLRNPFVTIESLKGLFRDTSVCTAASSC